MATQERTDYWQQQMVNWQASELSGQAFCKQQGIIYHIMRGTLSTGGSSYISFLGQIIPTRYIDIV